MRPPIRVPYGLTVSPGKPIFVIAVGPGSGLPHAAVSVNCNDIAAPVNRRCVTLTVACPGGSMTAVMGMDEVDCLRDQLTACADELARSLEASR